MTSPQPVSTVNLRGVLVPMLTPLLPDESADLPSVERLIDYLISSGVHGLWLLGTSGEFAGLAAAERRRVVECTLAHVAGRVPVVVNVGDGSTKLAIEHARHAVACGARRLALTPPHYYLHSMDEVVAHFESVKAAADVAELYVYNIPQTVKVRITVATVAQLAAAGVVEGIKDSQNDLQYLRQLISAVRERGLGGSFRTFAGTRSLIDVAAVLGADGVIPATANVAPAECVTAFEAAVAGDLAEARAAQERVLSFQALAGVAHGGSGNAADLTTMKEILRMRGVIAHSTVTAPLRSLDSGEVELLGKHLADISI